MNSHRNEATKSTKEKLLSVSIIDRATRLPPVRKRPKLDGLQRYFVYMDYDRRADETFIYYRTFLLNAALVSGLLIIFMTSFLARKTIDIGFIQVQYDESLPVDTLVFDFPKTIFPFVAVFVPLYSVLMTYLRTDYFSANRIATEVSPRHHSNKNLYNLSPLAFLSTFIFATAAGFYVWGFPYYLRSYRLYNLTHDFNEQSFVNFILFSLIYLIFYSTVLCQLLAMSSINFVRSIIKLSSNSKGNI